MSLQVTLQEMRKEIEGLFSQAPPKNPYLDYLESVVEEKKRPTIDDALLWFSRLQGAPQDPVKKNLVERIKEFCIVYLSLCSPENTTIYLPSERLVNIVLYFQVRQRKVLTEKEVDVVDQAVLRNKRVVKIKSRYGDTKALLTLCCYALSMLGKTALVVVPKERLHEHYLDLKRRLKDLSGQNIRLLQKQENVEASVSDIQRGIEIGDVFFAEPEQLALITISALKKMTKVKVVV